MKTFFLFSIFYFLFSICYAQPVSSAELINNAKQYDGKAVVYEGEVIGDIMRRGRHCWINVSDGRNTIGIWMELSLAGQISHTGSYKSIGDGVEINGIFHRACPEHGADLDIHAQSLRKVAAGRIITEKLNLQKKDMALILLGVLCLVWILSLLIRR